VLAVLFDIVDKVIEQHLFLGSQSIRFRWQVGRCKRGRFDDFTDSLFINCLDGLFGCIDFVSQPVDFGRVEGIVRALGCPVALCAQLLDKLARISVERFP